MPRTTPFESAKAKYDKVTATSPVGRTALRNALTSLEETGTTAYGKKEVTRNQFAMTLRDGYQLIENLEVKPPVPMEQLEAYAAKAAMYDEMITPEEPTTEPAGPTDTTQIPTDQRKA